MQEEETLIISFTLRVVHEVQCTIHVGSFMKFNIQDTQFCQNDALTLSAASMTVSLELPPLPLICSTLVFASRFGWNTVVHSNGKQVIVHLQKTKVANHNIYGYNLLQYRMSSWFKNKRQMKLCKHVTKHITESKHSVLHSVAPLSYELCSLLVLKSPHCLLLEKLKSSRCTYITQADNLSSALQKTI